MDFEDSAEEAAFRIEARTWLAAHAPQHEQKGDGDPTDQYGLKAAKAWQMEKYKAGWACISWPKEYGGRSATPMETVIWGQEESQYSLPGGQFGIGQGMAAPVMMTYATEEQKKRYVPKLASGEEIWCQLFSEPAGGSDVAGLRTRADKDGDDWIINGQKVWTSGAQYCDFGIIVTRSDFTRQKHQGLTFFFLDMKSEGIDIRPIRQMSGGANFNEVFFTDVRVPDSQRLGEENEGWGVSLTTLMNERNSVGGDNTAGWDSLFEMARTLMTDDGPAINDKNVRSQLADWYVRASGIRYTGFRTRTALSRGETPGPEASIGKLVNAKNMQDMASFAMDMLDMGGMVMDPKVAEISARFQNSYLGSPGMRIAGGTDEILRNTIAERVLGLPQESRPDKGIPFNEIPTGKKN